MAPTPRTASSRSHRRRRARSAVAVVALVGLVAACGGDDGNGGAAAGAGDVSVVATTTVLGDITAAVVDCAGGDSATLMPAGVDPHDFAPSSAEVAELVGADLVVANGLDLEAGLQDALDAARRDGAEVLEVAPLVDPIPFGEVGHDDEHADDEHAGDEHGDLDPHVWLDVARMATAAEVVATELGRLTGATEAFATCGDEVAADLMALDEEVRGLLAQVPAERRVLVTDHEAFGYFAEAYGFEVAGVVVPGGSTLASASSAELAELVDTVEREGVTAVFANAAVPSDLVDALSAEVGDTVSVVELFVGSVGPEGSDAATYQGMMRTNAERIAGALGG